MPANAYLDFVKDPDQASRRAELVAFFGPRPEKFLKIYDDMAAIANRQPGTPIKFSLLDGSICWPAFFLGPVWMIYRKMWLYAGLVFVVAILFAFLPIPPGAVIGLNIGIALASARLYVTQSIAAISKLRGNPAALAAASGVSPVAGGIGGIVFVILLGFAGLHARVPRTKVDQVDGTVPQSLREPAKAPPVVR